MTTTNLISQFNNDSPFAQYMGEQNGEKVWIEKIQEPVTGIEVTLAYTTSDNGKTSEAYCIDPDMRDHDMDEHKTHLYKNARICTDLPNITRNLPEKRARAILWLSGFANYLKEGVFVIDQV